MFWHQKMQILVHLLSTPCENTFRRRAHEHFPFPSRQVSLRPKRSSCRYFSLAGVAWLVNFSSSDLICILPNFDLEPSSGYCSPGMDVTLNVTSQPTPSFPMFKDEPSIDIKKY